MLDIKLIKRGMRAVRPKERIWGPLSPSHDDDETKRRAIIDILLTHFFFSAMKFF